MESFEFDESKSDLEEVGSDSEDWCDPEEVGSDSEDWYRDSDSSQDLPHPNDDENPLYQDVNKLPVPLEKKHFQEGLIYAMTLEGKSNNTMLVMIITTKQSLFIYRVFFVRGSSRKTYHEGGDDKKSKYCDVWRLAPRRELLQPCNPENVRAGQTVRFSYEDEIITALIIKRTSKYLRGQIECGRDRGNVRDFLQIEVLDCQELFGSSLLQNLLKQVKNTTWSNADKSKSQRYPPHKPKLHPEYMVPAPIENKRLWHFRKILGEGAELLCACTTKRGKRSISTGKSEKYKKRWKDLNGPRL